MGAAISLVAHVAVPLGGGALMSVVTRDEIKGWCVSARCFTGGCPGESEAEKPNGPRGERPPAARAGHHRACGRPLLAPHLIA